MAKRNKAKFASKSRKSALRVEALEQRQLLATVTGGGTEVGANIQHPNGNVYDQVLMTGSAVTVTADPGQVTRVSFLDASGDIVQAEFAGAGTLLISLDGFVAAAEAKEYNQPGVQYVSGNATFTIQGSDANTNFSAFSVGPLNAVNQALFSGGKDGGNNLADVQAVVIVNNPLNPGGFSNFGGLRMGNAWFSGSAGNVGITAANVSVQGPVIIGDINASDVGVPVLTFGTGSQFNTLTVAGGDLVQSNGALIVSALSATGGVAGIQSINFTAGATSKGDILRAQVNPNVGVGAGIFVAADPAVATLDATTSFDITGKTQGQIDDMFLGRTFTNAITVKGELAVNQTITPATTRKGITFENAIFGNVTATAGDLGPIVIKGELSGNLMAASGAIGNLTVEGDLSGMVGAKSIGDVLIKGGNLSGSLTTDVVVANDAWNSGEGRIGNVTIQTATEEDGDIVGGSITGDGAIEGVLGIGNVTVAKDITSDGGAYLGVLSTHGTGTGDAFLANIGKLTVEGDIDQGKTSAPLIRITGNGAYGDVLVKGASPSKDNPTQIGAILVDGHLGSEAAKAGTISITEMDENIEWGGMIINGDFGTVGAITITGDSDTTFTLTTPNMGDAVKGDALNGIDIDGTDMSVKGLTITGFKTITTALGDADGADNDPDTHGDDILPAVIDLHKGPVTLTTAAVDNATITINGDIGVRNSRDTGAIVLNAGTASGSLVDLEATIGADDLANVTITAKTIDMTGSGRISADNSAKDITLNGAVTMDATAIELTGRKNLANLTVNGTTSLTGTQTFGNVTGAVTFNGDVTFTGAGQFKFQGDVAKIVVNGDLNMDANTGTSFLLNNETDNNGSANDVLGAFIVNGQVVGADGVKNDIRASKIGELTIKGALTQDQILVTNLNVLAAPNGDGSTDGSEKLNRDGSNLSDYSIGNITIQSVLDLAYTGTSLFSGDNTFAALQLGDINVVGATAGAQQSRLFVAATDSAWFGAGDVDGLLNLTTTLGTNVLVWDSNSDGTTEDRSAFQTDLTGGTYSVGNVTVNALQTVSGLGISGVDNIAGATAAGGGSAEGFAVLAGVRQVAATGDLITYGAAGFTAVNAIDIDTDVKGTIGNVLIASYNAVGFVDPVLGPGNAGNALVGPAADTASAILAATSVGTVQGVTPAVGEGGTIAGLNESGDAAIIGDLDAVADNTVEDDNAGTLTVDETTTQIVVLVV